MNNTENLDWDKIVNHLSDLATSDIVKDELSQLSALKSTTEAEESFSKIFESIELLSAGQRPFMESLGLFNTWAKRLEKSAVLKTLELKDIRHFCIEAIALKDILKMANGPWLKSLPQQIEDMDGALSAIDQVMSPHGEIKSDASEALYNLTREKNDLGKQVQKSLDKIVKDHELETVLQDRYVTNREGRWVIPVKSGKQHDFQGIIHASSHSKLTVFMEPQEVVPINNRLRQIDADIEAEIERLLTDLSKYLHSLIDKFYSTKKVLHECDLVFAKAQLSIQLKATVPEFSQKQIELREVKHPILLLNQTDVIANDVQLDSEKRILLLSGPNAGGKTVLLKSVGLAAQMARCGLPICAKEGSKIPFFSNLTTAIGDSQSVDENLSTFAAHLQILDSATKLNGPENLLLIDEICGSTDPEEGTALARSFIENYAGNKLFAVITSHLGALKKGWDENSGVINGSLEFDKEKGPTYQFLMGVPGQSLAVQTARRVGVDSSIIDAALKFLSPEHRKYQQNLEEAEKIKKQLSQMQVELRVKIRESEEAKQAFEKKQRELEQHKEDILLKTKKKAEREFEKILEQARAKQSFKKHEDLAKIKQAMPEIIKAPSAGQIKEIETAEEFAQRFPAGSKVFCHSLNTDVVVQGEPNNKGEVPILSNSMRLAVAFSDLRPPNNYSNPTKEVMRQRAQYIAPLAEGDRVVDLRGLAIDEATQQLELQLDTAALNSEDRVKIIHGHGTNALKRSIRSYLSRSVYVKKWQAGSSQTGGDGVTWVEIKA